MMRGRLFHQASIDANHICGSDLRWNRSNSSPLPREFGCIGEVFAGLSCRASGVTHWRKANCDKQAATRGVDYFTASTDLAVNYSRGTTNRLRMTRQAIETQHSPLTETAFSSTCARPQAPP